MLKDLKKKSEQGNEQTKVLQKIVCGIKPLDDNKYSDMQEMDIKMQETRE